MVGALADVSVLDLTQGVAGPYCTKLLACFGAEVVKVEAPGVGDYMRRLGPFVGDDPHPETSIPFLYLNTGKKSVTLDLEEPSGRRLLLDLARKADIVVESFVPGRMAAWGLGYEVLSEMNPRLVMTSISHFGQTGPYSGYKGEEIVDQALSSQISITGEPDREPLKMGGDLAQYVGGQTAYTGTLIALFHAQLKGEGQHVDSAILDANVDILDHEGLSGLSGDVRGRWGNTTDTSFLRGRGGLYECLDGWISLGLTPGGWDAFVDMVDLPELRNPIYRDPMTRGKHAREIEGIVEPWLRERTRLEIYQASQKKRNAIGYVATPGDMLSSPHLQSREFFKDVPHPVAGPARYPGVPFGLSDTPGSVGRSPLLGEHNREVYCQRLGLTPEDLVALRQHGII